MDKSIIVVVRHMTDGGAERVLSELIEDWVNKGIKVTIVQLNPGEFSESYKLPESVCFANLHWPKIRAFAYLCNTFELIRYLRKNRDSIVLAFVVKAVIVLGMAAPFIPNEVVVSERTAPRTTPPLWCLRIMRNLAFHFADKCVFQTEEAMTYFPNSVQKKGIIIPNPINKNLPERYIGERRKVIVTACRLESQKNIPMLLEAFAKLNQEYPEYDLEVYGRGNEEDALQMKIRQLGLTGKAKLMGFSQDIFMKIRDCTMFALSSNYEGISNSMLEALALGLPCVCTDCPAGGARMSIQDGVSGLLVPVGDVEAMYKAMKRIIEDPIFAKKLSDNAYLIRERFSIDSIGKQWLDFMYD